MDYSDGIPSRAWGLIGVVTAFLILTVLSVGARVYVRVFMIRSFGWDDWLMLVALVSHAERKLLSASH